MRPRNLIENASLENLSTMATPAVARYLVSARDAREARNALEWASEQGLPVQLVGGGSNLIFCDDFPGLVLHMALKGRHWASVEGDSATLVLAAGENWHQAVLYAAAAGYGGLENLALIPGTAGAAPVQNIGAYGVELSDTFVGLTAWDRQAGQEVSLTAADCRFGYRDSLFKQEADRYLILEIRLALSRSRPYVLGYGQLSQWFDDKEPSSPMAVAEAVMALRRRKLPDPSQLPNTGSFFKNPVVPRAQWQALQEQWPEMVAYPMDDGVKLAAGWLIEQCGWKGYRNRTVGVHHRQALVLVNHSSGTGADVLALARRIRDDVQDSYGVTLEVEPGVVPADCGLAPRD
ncbi:UDP-N-acetylenolpyruvoylglucosamine reductase [Marinobacter zhanjiangensis]|uniref:UDP-N-acetylenolpyruvoylglucosamine reductase n=2 Tax=Marinobacter zhanjiangensis TaxID=578215 RepID=A0ABQ3B9C1_9GAMM|nr:UDP-N-acetylmuramate dehydrogenase [Marinobacter zhanjiangensis]GGY85039.1 UDP-N-acetylenolpyruvoylglucosamine reductase [Marinobacter zhanjiangensis]